MVWWFLFLREVVGGFLGVEGGVLFSLFIWFLSAFQVLFSASPVRKYFYRQAAVVNISYEVMLIG